ncbi:MAG: DNA mismatch repair endonuclease MutL [Clostridia bacterium]|nr:DNA mismatch repair endonuclease MutL [Clostridia bacterium]
MKKINVMPDYLAELIAAGEVVERPASVVKELLENSIDAGASNITLEIRNGGITYIRVTDNGSGIDPQDVRDAFVSHATSKITTFEDLNSILTLGFRGEALASIAAVSKIDLLTRLKGSGTGTRYCVEYGEETLLDEAGCPEGTTITVRDIFQKTPARMKFLKKDVTEANAVAAVADRIALSHPEVTFRFIRDGKQVLMTTGSGDLLTCIREVFGKEFASQMIPCEGSSDAVKIEGYISKPVFSRPNRNMQFFFLNNRCIKTGTCSAALSEGYKNSIMVGKFPACVINIDIDPSRVDVNVHPAKTEVRFSDERPVFNAVYSGVKNALALGDTRKQIFADTLVKRENTQKYTGSAKQTAEQIKMAPPRSDFWQHYTPQGKSVNALEGKKPAVTTTFTANSPVETLQPDDERIDSREDILLNSRPIAEPVREEVPEPVIETPEQLSGNDGFDEQKFHLVGEAFTTYIICEYDKKLVIIDKHAAHERIIYERLKKEHGERSGQMLLAPVTVTLPKEEYSAVLENADLLSDSGFAVEDFGSGCVLVRECPMELEAAEIEEVISEIAGRFVEKKQDVSFEKLDWIFHSVACRSAVKAGNFTSEYEMEIFAKQLLSMPDIRYCPHGRPVLIEMTQRELEKNFGRV